MVAEKTTWKVKAIAFNDAVKAVIAEIKTPALTPNEA